MNDNMERLRRMFYPESVAVIGASANPQKWGFGILHNLLQGNFPGKVYPINLAREEILGVRCYKKLSDIPGKVDLVVVVVPPENLEEALKDCVSKEARRRGYDHRGHGRGGRGRQAERGGDGREAQGGRHRRHWARTAKG